MDSLIVHSEKTSQNSCGFISESKPVREEIAAEVYEDEVDLRRSATCLNNSFRSLWSERSMDPEDFRDELKKLYAQLEVHKTRKMTANNPHLSKKRSSRCALGRSLIKRIAEFPETVSRRYSREERDGSFHSRRGSHCDSYVRSPDTFSISYRGSIKSPSPSIRKSHSDHQYARERVSSFRDSRLRANSVKRSSQRSETDSLDIPPGVCKSASAQNLSIDTNLLHPDHTRLHKSWSLSSSTTHSTENIPKISRASTMKSRQSISIGDQTRSALQSESFDKAEVCPWEVEADQSGEKNQKHVTYASSTDGEEKDPSSPQALVCPWDHLPSEEKSLSVEKEPQANNVSPKAPVTVSASAPGSPRPKVTKDQRVFSFRATTNKWLSVRSFMTSTDSIKSKDGHLNREDSGSQKSQGSTSTTPRSGASSRRPSISLQKTSVSTTDGKPCLVKQNAVRLSSGDSADRSPRRLVIVKSATCTSDVDDMQKDGNHEHGFLSRQSSKRSSISSWETASTSRTPSTRRRGSNRVRPACNVAYTDICPWDGASILLQGEGPKSQQSIKANISSQELPISEQSHVCSLESQEQGNLKRQESGQKDVCPWEMQDIPAPVQTTMFKEPLTESSKKHVADVCPWEAVETPQISIRQDSDYANICPWEVQDTADIIYENLNSSENKGTLAVPFPQEVMKPAIYPASLRGVKSGDQQSRFTPSPALHLSEQLSKTVNPWGFPDPPKIMNEICPWEGISKEPPNTDSASMSVKLDVCPWEAGQRDEPSVSPTAVVRQAEDAESARGDVCPREPEPTPKKAVTKSRSLGPKHLSDVCPWESGEPKPGNPDVCPWDTAEPKLLKKTNSALEDVCPWDVEDTKVAKKQNSIREDVCPWETREPMVLKKQHSTQADICPWETADTEEAKTQHVSREYGCPSSEEPREYELNDPSGAGKPYASKIDEDEEREMQRPLDKDEDPEDEATELTDESKANLTLSRRDALCPWETIRSTSGSFMDNASDVFTWEPENIPEEDEEDDAECAAEALVFPSDL